MHGTIESATESAYEVEVRPLAELASIEPEWRALAARALMPNVFYEPQFALAAAPALGRNVEAGLVWLRGKAARLVGLFPARIERHRYGLPWPIVVGWISPYAPLGVPLIDREAAEPVISAFLDHLGSLAPYLPALARGVVPAERAYYLARHRPDLVAARVACEAIPADCPRAIALRAQAAVHLALGRRDEALECAEEGVQVLARDFEPEKVREDQDWLCAIIAEARGT